MDCVIDIAPRARPAAEAQPSVNSATGLIKQEGGGGGGGYG